MRFLSNFLLFAAYVLIYSAVAAGGKFATEPWAALFADAYTTPDSQASIIQDASTAAIGVQVPNVTGLPVRPRTLNFTG